MEGLGNRVCDKRSLMLRQDTHAKGRSERRGGEAVLKKREVAFLSLILLKDTDTFSLEGVRCLE